MGFARVLRGRICACILGIAVLVLVAWTQPASVAEPPRHTAFHLTVQNGEITGSAFAIQGGIAVTNAHVVAGKSPGDKVAMKTSREVWITAEIWAVSDDMDLAILRFDGHASVSVPPLRARAASRGATLFAVGTSAVLAGQKQTLVARGVVTATDQRVEPFGEGMVVAMPQVRKGFSGGPVFDAQGDVVGMVAALRESTGAEGHRREAFILSIAGVYAETLRLTSQP